MTWSPIKYLSLPLSCILLVGCGEKQPVGGNFYLVTPPTMWADSHPGTSLYRFGGLIWGNVYMGCFESNNVKPFYHDGTFVFVGALPGRNDWSGWPQLFAVRNSETPVILSERLVGRKLSVTNYNHLGDFSAEQISVVDGSIRIQISLKPATNLQMQTNEISWKQIDELLDEAKTNSQLVPNPMGNFRLLPAN